MTEEIKRERKMTEEITEIMDEEEYRPRIQIRPLSQIFQDIVIAHIPTIRNRIRAQIVEHIKKKQAFIYYLEMRSFMNMGCTKIGMFEIGNGNTATDPALSNFLYTIPYIFTPEALKQFLETTINITGIREYNPDGLNKPLSVTVQPNGRNNTVAAKVIIGRYPYQWNKIQ